MFSSNRPVKLNVDSPRRELRALVILLFVNNQLYGNSQESLRVVFGIEVPGILNHEEFVDLDSRYDVVGQHQC